MTPKEVAGRRAAEYIEEGMIVGLGTGSTAEFTIRHAIKIACSTASATDMI